MIDRDQVDPLNPTSANPRPSDTFANPYRPVEIEPERTSGMGTWVGLAIAALVIVGGFTFYYNHAPATFAANSTSPAITSPSITPAQPAMPMRSDPAPAPSMPAR
jgi:hypothetical protein